MSDTSKKIEAQQREMPEPWEGNRPVPWLVLGIIAGLFLWAAGYIIWAFHDIPPEYGDQRTVADFTRPESGSDDAGSIDGGKIYAANCVACHQADGAGVPGVFPPLIESEWVTGKPEVLVQILLHGIHGELTVGDDVYDGDMPAFAKLDDAELAALATHLRSNFDNDEDAVSAEFVTEQRDAYDRDEPWNGDEDLQEMR